MKPNAPSLHELQMRFGGSLRDAADGGVRAFIVANGMDQDDRLALYRNTMEGVLVRALALAFPAVRKLVGEEFFEGASRLFIERAPPESACLDHYGRDFPGFLQALPQAASLPYLADVARLEWEVNLMLHALDAKPLDLAQLATLDEVRLGQVGLKRHPAARLIQSDFPVDAIWRCVLEADEAGLAAIDLTGGPVWLLVRRGQAGIEMNRLAEPEWRFMDDLFAGLPLQQAVEDALCTDCEPLLGRYLAEGLFIGLRQPTALFPSGECP
jgi:hypothetical protein